MALIIARLVSNKPGFFFLVVINLPPGSPRTEAKGTGVALRGSDADFIVFNNLG